MPYFYKEGIVNLLFIHIPKTGGTSVENYFSWKYDIKLNNDSLYKFLNMEEETDNLKDTIKELDTSISLQHQTYGTLYKFRDAFKIKFDNSLKIISIVRNPYERVISELFWKRIINKNSTKEEVYNAIKKFVINIIERKNMYDNHNIPQYKFLVDDNGNIDNNIILLKTENLSNGMKSLGYNDFNVRANVNPVKSNYYDYLNDSSINIINDIYHKDFILFGYDKKIINI